MNKIFEIPHEIKAILSASEVIEEPLSVVKELIENSIDSGASKIEVEIKDGGMSLIRVKDNGSGMSRDDIRNSVKKYNTSKTKTSDDVYSPLNLGFRGEALFSISSISRLKILSRQEGSVDTWIVEFDGGDLKSQKPHPKIDGTDIFVTDLFYNTPGRRHFLNNSKFSTSKIKNLVQQFSLIYNEIEFSFRSLNSKERLLFSSDRFDLDAMTFLKAQDENSLISDFNSFCINSGLWSVESFLYPTNKNCSLISINGRIISIPWMHQLIKNSYGFKTKNYKQNFSYILKINVKNLTNGDINFNYHPRKRELFFTNENQLKLKFEELFQKIFSKYVTFDHFDFSFDTNSLVDVGRNILGRPIGQAHNSWILSQTDTDMFIIDQHAAHERILFEKIKKSIRDQFNEKSELLSFIKLHEKIFIDDSIAIIFKYEILSSYLQKIGFKFLVVDNSLYLTHIPSIITQNTNWADFFIDYFTKASVSSLDKDDQLIDLILDLANKTCKMAIKAGDSLSLEEINTLLRDIERYPEAMFCNHGRPTIKKLTKQQIEDFFGR